jgi:F-type H+-transporting ATPase subunit delta
LSAVSTYAEALFEAAQERDELEEALANLQEFTGALEESEELRLFFYGGQVPEREKRRAIDGLTEGMTLSTRNFLKILSDNGREEILEEALLRYEELVKEHLGRVEVEVTTAVELSEDELNRIKERLGRSLEGREVILQTSVDPTILGGAVFRFGGRMVDSSVRGRLASLREEMLERGVVSG